jgi:hypothetical protein
MKIYKKLTEKLESYKEELLITDSVELYFNSPSNTYIVMDSMAKIYFEGTLDECCAYTELSICNYLKIWSKECYEGFLKKAD